MSRPRLLDLFCGAGGAAMGYHRAGFDVVGVDIRPQPHYPFEFFQYDALQYLEVFPPTWPDWPFDAIHASPPCQWGTAYKRRPDHVKESPNLVGPVRDLLASGLPYVIEQPESNRATLAAPITLCGSSFGLDVRRHRCFETSFAMMSAPCSGHLDRPAQYAHATNRRNERRTVEVGVWRIPLNVQRQAMGVDWMTLDELAQAIPPAYTEFIGGQLMAHLGVMVRP